MVSGYLRVIQVYAPTTAHTDDEYYEFLDHVMEALNARSSASSRKKCTKIVIGDFNAMVGCGNAEEQYIGPYGLGVHNQRGNILAHFCCETHLHVMNNHFQKKTNFEEMDVDLPKYEDKKCYRLSRSTVGFSLVSKALRESLEANIERKHLSRTTSHLQWKKYPKSPPNEQDLHKTVEATKKERWNDCKNFC
ncbi:hypothetical protein ANCCEY_14083 [Ancylostoma ceylanicum]|uniref:Endonuclease/exonuclease/phosphatase domain-containing protein n=1 Tax=Ancylostoma ceylanicum TaxID=53326 RepID=A0A0D6LAP5_9BILA|nr:hypothetical protein ANCCEY_14083 [Ancylostoma ceylanicum]